MYELVQAGAQSYYINSPAKIGVYLAGDGDAYLIDSGNDKDAGRKAKQLLAKMSLNLKGIINTHSHADHIGGNQYLQKQTGCAVFAAGIEAAFTNSPILEPSFLYGAYPCNALRHKFLLAAESEAVAITSPSFPKELEVIPLPGHSFDMIGIRTPDDTVFIADCVSSKATLEKYRFSFIYDVAAYLSTLEKVEAMQAKLFVPSHAEASANITALVCANRDAVYEIAEDILKLCKTPCNFEVLLKDLFSLYNLTMNFEQYVLVGSTLKSYLSWLKDSARLTATFENNLLLWGST